MYSVKEIFYTLQGEGANAGTPAVFCRFTGCNLWSGREADRATAACDFCDTDFVGTDGPGGGKFQDARTLADAVQAAWPGNGERHRFVVFTGGEAPVPLVSGAAAGRLPPGVFPAGRNQPPEPPPPRVRTGLCGPPRHTGPSLGPHGRLTPLS